MKTYFTIGLGCGIGTYEECVQGARLFHSRHTMWLTNGSDGHWVLADEARTFAGYEYQRGLSDGYSAVSDGKETNNSPPGADDGFYNRLLNELYHDRSRLEGQLRRVARVAADVTESVATILEKITNDADAGAVTDQDTYDLAMSTAKLRSFVNEMKD